MLVLAVDTTSERGGVALFQDEETLAVAASEGAAGYSVTLFQMVDRVIEEARARQAVLPRGLADIELYAVANGPGSFTGIRVGLAAGQAWAKAFGRPAFGISILEAMVGEARPNTELAVPLLDARRNDLYHQVFRRAAVNVDGFVPEGEGEVSKPDALPQLIEESLRSGASVTCVAREHDALASSLRAVLSPVVRWQIVSGPLLAAIARLGLAGLRRGKTPSHTDLDACYIRRTDAELHLKG
jgi:tRNA threonylcarbamoyladenosine biosynthesis protein TsaB